MISEWPVLARVARQCAARVAWLLLAFAVAMVVFSALLVNATIAASGEGAGPYWINTVSASVAFSTVGALIASRRMENPFGWLLLLAGCFYGVTALMGEYGAYLDAAAPGSLPGEAAANWIASWLWIPSSGFVVYSFLIFPNGRLPSPRWRAVGWMTIGIVCLTTASFAFDAPDTILTATASLLAVTALTTTLAVFLRLRDSAGVERQQLKWVAYAVSLLAVAVVVNSISATMDESLVGRALFLVSFLAIPASIGIAILRYRLYDIDVLINRTLVYGALTVCVVGFYVLVVGYLSTLLRTGENVMVSLVATGLVAMLFQPLRERLQRGVNRLMYGDRDDPYAALSRLGQRLEATPEPASVLPTVVETVRDALKLSYAAVALGRDGGYSVVASTGEPATEPMRLPLVHQGEPVGDLLVSPRAPGEGWSSADLRLLDDLAHQAGAAVHGVRLTRDLQSSRESLVLAREEERRRLRRDLHDELAPTLASLSLTAATAIDLIEANPDAAAALVAELHAGMRAAVGDIRRLAYELRPPALDEFGLVAAVQERADRHDGHGLQVTVDAPDCLPPLPAAVEVAAYRIIQEGLMNVVRHANAGECVIRLASTTRGERPGLYVEIVDNGVGIPEAGRKIGVGLHSMRERAAELGGECSIGCRSDGGTAVVAWLPLAEGETRVTAPDSDR